MSTHKGNHRENHRLERRGKDKGNYRDSGCPRFSGNPFNLRPFKGRFKTNFWGNLRPSEHMLISK